MDLLYSSLFGISMKIYDDIVDLKLINNDLIIELFKSLNVLLFTILGYNDFLFSLYIFILSLSTYGADDNHWKTFILLSFVLCIIFFKLPDNILVFIGGVIISIIVLNYEHKLMPEEISFKKLVFRTICLLFFILSIYLLYVYPFFESYLGDVRYIIKMAGIGAGSMFVSIITQIYFLYFNKSISDEMHVKQVNQ